MKKDGSVRVITKNHDTLDKGEFERIGQLGGFYRKQARTYVCPTAVFVHKRQKLQRIMLQYSAGFEPLGDIRYHERKTRFFFTFLAAS